MRTLILVIISCFILSCESINQSLWNHDGSEENLLSYEVTLINNDGNYSRSGVLRIQWNNEGLIMGQWISNQNDTYEVKGQKQDSGFIIELFPYGIDSGESISGTFSTDKQTIGGDWEQMTIAGPLTGSFNGFSTGIHP